MKRKGRDRRVLLAGIGGVVAGSFLAAGKARAGQLNPPNPGPVTPTGIALADIEPRKPVNDLPSSSDALHVLSDGGSYKLTGHLIVSSGQVALKITARDPVSIDLAGFTISGGPGGGGGGGIRVEAPTPGGCPYVEVFDGYIRGMAGDGIDGGTARVVECYDLHIDSVGTGITVNGSLTVEACLVEHCASDGIRFTASGNTGQYDFFFVDDSECRACSGHGIHVAGDWSAGSGALSITDVDVVGNLLDGIHVEAQMMPGGVGGHLTGRIQAVRATVNSGAGIDLRAPVSPLGIGPKCSWQCADVMCAGNVVVGFHLSDSTSDLIDVVCSRNTGDGFHLENVQGCVDACSALQNTGDGLHVLGSSRLSVSDCAAHSNGGSGIHLDLGVTHVVVQDSDASSGATGVRVQSPGNLLLRNTAVGNGVDYDLEPTTPVVIVSPSQLSSSSNPHANYSS